MKKILYIGGFEMPDKNAAAQRVLSIAKALREAGYDTMFYGITQDGNYEGNVDGFNYDAYPHPNGTIAWFKYALGTEIIEYVRKASPDYVILYNYPAIAQEKVIRFCRKNGIKTVGDITEWYRPKTLPKRIDTYLRMKISNRHLDGIIAISRYLADYYSGQNKTLLPPMVDKTETKWSIKQEKHQDNKIHLVYIGTGSIKDRLDKVFKGINLAGTEKFYLDVIGITEQQYVKIYQQELKNATIDVSFHGRLPHQEALKYLMGADFQIFFRDFIRVNNAGFPTKFVESMSAGVPVITNRISNLDDYIRNGENSFMIEHPEEGEICDVLKHVSSLTRAEIDTIKSNCLKDEFDFRRFIGQLDSFMNSL